MNTRELSFHLFQAPPGSFLLGGGVINGFEVSFSLTLFFPDVAKVLIFVETA